MLVTWGREFAEDGTYVWKEVTTDANGYNDSVYFTTLLQTIQLNINESPMYGNYGIPSINSLVHQIVPDYYTAVLQQQFAPYFADLKITRIVGEDPPTYSVQAVAHNGAILTNGVPPQ